MSSRFSFVYFDLDDTLLDHRSAERLALADLHAEYFASGDTIGLEQLQHDYHEGNVVLWKRYSLAEITGDELRFSRFATLCDKYAIGIDPMVLSRRYMQLYSRHWTALPGAEQMFDSIATTTRVGIITNGFAATQREKLKRFPRFSDAADAIVISEEFGHMKPSPKLFEHARLQTNCSADEILYVGDSWHSDVEGGLAAGWHVAWYSSETPDARTVSRDSANRLFQFSDWDALIRHCQVL